ncbi:MAG TPA: hypothetical protein VLA24_16200, partial [Pseudomonadales bacterium]|nr:hypothetical protein [Pseudomonadales bacterium]
TQNVFQGSFAGYNNTTGSYNTSLGYNAYAVSGTAATGNYNTAIGNGALNQNTTASQNTAVGYQAGYSNTTGANNTVMGFQAGYGLTTGARNTFVGAYNGSNGSGRQITTGSANTILGGFDGNQGGLDIRTSSNYIVLSDGDGNPKQYYSNNRNNWALRSGNAGIARVESDTLDGISVANGSTLTLTNAAGECGAILAYVYENGAGQGAVFFIDYLGTATLVASDGTGNWATTDAAGKFCVYKSGSTHTAYFKNNSGSSRNMNILLVGGQAAYS